MTIRWPAVAFDLDGLLLDSEPFFFEAARRVLAKRGVEFDEAFMLRIMGIPGRASLPMFRDHFGLSDSVEVIGADYYHHFKVAVADSVIPLKPGARDLIERFSDDGLPLAIVTSSHREFVEQTIGAHRLLERFHHIISCESITNGKPSPDPYLLAAKKLGVPPRELLVFEDSINGVRAAKAAGCCCVAVPQEHTPREKVVIADHVAESLDEEELSNWLMGYCYV